MNPEFNGRGYFQAHQNARKAGSRFGKDGEAMIHSNTQAFCHRLNRRANAWAAIRGGQDYPRLLGSVKFFQTQAGVLVLAEVWGLPSQEKNPSGFFGFHIHSGGGCGRTGEMEFGEAEGHLNPTGVPHPEHMGDLPPLFAKNGYAWTVFLTSRFTIRDILGRTVILHASPDDFTSQPSGNAGKMIACGVIR